VAAIAVEGALASCGISALERLARSCMTRLDSVGRTNPFRWLSSARAEMGAEARWKGHVGEVPSHSRPGHERSVNLVIDNRRMLEVEISRLPSPKRRMAASFWKDGWRPEDV
jgi:hypothetical protein